MPVVPLRLDGTKPPPRPPDPTYTLIAASQMHSEGRLLATDQKPKPNARSASTK